MDEVVGVCSRGGGLPYYNVPYERGCTREVTTDGGEVERGDGEDEPFQWSILESVPDVLRVLRRLLAVQFFDTLHAKAEKIGKLQGGVSMRVMHDRGRGNVVRVGPLRSHA